jgi:Uma2 family endonuclease
MTAEQLLELPDDGVRHELVRGELRTMPPAGFRHGLVEVVSPYDRLGELTAKALSWLDAGARLVWVVDPDERLAIVHRPDGLARVLREDGELDGEDVLPGFRLPLSALFD